MTTRRRRRQDVEIEREIVAKARVGFSPPEIHEQLLKDFGEVRAPSLRTVQRVVAEMPAPGAPWSFKDSTAEETSVALQALRGLDWSGEMLIRPAPDGAGWVGRNQTTWWPTRRQIEWLARLRDAVPELSVVPAWYFAQEFMWREDHSEETRELDLALAFAPKGGESDLELLNRLMDHATIHLDRWPDSTFYAFTNDRAQPFIADLIEVVIELYFGATSFGPPKDIIWRPKRWQARFPLRDEIYREIDRIAETKAISRRDALDTYVAETFIDGLSPIERAKRQKEEGHDESQG